MENTFTVDTNVPTETLTDNLTSEEVDSLKVGEEIAEQQEQLLAGKYKDAAELEKAYKELEAKLGEQETETEQAEPEEETKQETSLSDNASLITDASEEYYSNEGKLSPETLDKFKGMSSEDLVNAYIEVTNSPDWQASPPTANDISDSQIDQVKTSVGGDQAYSNIVSWAGQNLDAEYVEAFDNIISNGDIKSIQLAVNGLKAQYEQANGYEGKMYTGKPPQTSGDVFRSQAELVQAMSDRRYDNDPAYRQDVIEKLERSDNLSF
tara:strand:+ start:530 stop:1327 length:798 start_codon:yes stop_codon:yes gene_type:complete